ncbi:MAG: hypothetical protein Greene041662_732 [Candidatus Peregrinibacteria bacterium Greene0416_62]|nr:MAG: hypothetical protein Greene041662_732 [Candidatus Peregrinibacteria bacterium Greene0416_62]TSC98152.1 MAG: hypothetical protein Greene101449_1008 [Candidatus Peregrinibacteria bacterium Greene1014_49]
MPIEPHEHDVFEESHPRGDLVSQHTAATRGRLQHEVTQREENKQSNLERDFFSLQIQFAHCVARVKGIPLHEALLRNTCLYRRFGLPRPLDPKNPVWERFLSDLELAEHPEDVAYAYATEHIAPRESSGRCFYYDYDAEEKAIHMHFANNDLDPRGPLSDARMPARLAELRAMFEEIKNQHPEAIAVSGSSWIYNVPNYRRLFPPEYTKEPKRAPNGYPGMSVWGQFINRNGQLKVKEVSEFLGKLSVAQTEEDIPNAFPMKELAVKGNIEEFYKFYGIT